MIEFPIAFLGILMLVFVTALILLIVIMVAALVVAMITSLKEKDYDFPSASNIEVRSFLRRGRK